MPSEEYENLLEILKERFEANMHRHKNLKWKEIEEKLRDNPDHLHSLKQMEQTDGEPDVIRYDDQSDEYIFADCSKESPKGRRSVCYDQAALESRKKHKPDHSACELAEEMGIKLLSEEEYRYLQELDEFDLKTSSWIDTPSDVRQLGGALFGDRRYGRVFTYHNGAESYYKSRGFRGSLRI
ncbi:DUF4256 domain-containing protein [Piscibacillus salipiscarius]|uniref:DUF4256 domain-containing protein n=1 Tax=Piscibacillus salipiscarius TaxID=299480 RepID=A0ABW5QAC0_9BACI|nr:DUF4256 domain-containing protein [Piscibacillus salipiscarius]